MISLIPQPVDDSNTGFLRISRLAEGKRAAANGNSFAG
jgi:hypothetical protein